VLFSEAHAYKGPVHFRPLSVNSLVQVYMFLGNRVDEFVLVENRAQLQGLLMQ